jgi:hypothetical protein
VQRFGACLFWPLAKFIESRDLFFEAAFARHEWQCTRRRARRFGLRVASRPPLPVKYPVGKIRTQLGGLR